MLPPRPTQSPEPAWHLKPIWRVSPLLWPAWLCVRAVRGLLWFANWAFGDSDKRKD